MCKHASYEKSPFFRLRNLLRKKNLLRDNINSSVEEQVAMFLHVIEHNQHYRVVHQTWRRSIETVHRYFQEVLYAVGELMDQMIKDPPSDTPLKITNNHRWNPYFKIINSLIFLACVR
jgi:hypothetical protein